ncbi:MAG: DUF4145 domain-containing protein [Candidatus Daviesbacteria bacterium]|nr:DUF4145 domain-containing protein [Candidatus Daviesbacteria bacterium]
MSQNFTCPYCNRPTTITDPNRYVNWDRIVIEDSDRGKVGTSILAITCPNAECKKLYLKVSLTNAQNNQSTGWNWKSTRVLQEWSLLPESQAKVLPEYVPVPIAEDYYEACRIRDLSPKASATLSRRCLQGMIRNFWGVSKRTLKEEIDALEDKVDSDTWESIEAVRKVGNIGAHMQEDTNLIIEVDAEEAQLLIGLIEQLIVDWYVIREERRKRTEALKELAKLKEEKRKGNKNGKSE